MEERLTSPEGDEEDGGSIPPPATMLTILDWKRAALVMRICRGFESPRQLHALVRGPRAPLW